MSIQVVRKIDVRCDANFGKSGETDLWGHKGHSHDIWESTEPVPSKLEFQDLPKSGQSLKVKILEAQETLKINAEELRSQKEKLSKF